MNCHSLNHGQIKFFLSLERFTIVIQGKQCYSLSCFVFWTFNESSQDFCFFFLLETDPLIFGSGFLIRSEQDSNLRPWGQQSLSGPLHDARLQFLFNRNVPTRAAGSSSSLGLFPNLVWILSTRHVPSFSV